MDSGLRLHGGRLCVGMGGSRTALREGAKMGPRIREDKERGAMEWG